MVRVVFLSRASVVTKAVVCRFGLGSKEKFREPLLLIIHQEPKASASGGEAPPQPPYALCCDQVGQHLSMRNEGLEDPPSPLSPEGFSTTDSRPNIILQHSRSVHLHNRRQ